MSFINDNTPPVVQHRNWNWRIGQSAAGAAPFLLVVGNEVAGAGVLQSSDGVTWTLGPATGSGFGTAYAAASASVVMLSGTQTSDTAPPALTWSVNPVFTPGPAMTWAAGLAYSASLNRWLASFGTLTTSDDNGVTWTPYVGQPFPSGTPSFSVAWSDTYGAFYGVNEWVLGLSSGWKSTTGLEGSWAAVAGVTSGVSSLDCRGVCCGGSVVYISGGQFSAVTAANVRAIWKSTDGQNFTRVYFDVAGPNKNVNQIACDPTGQIALGLVDGQETLFTNNGGGSWLAGSVGGALQVFTLFYYRGWFYLVRRNGEIYRTQDGAAFALVAGPFGAAPQWQWKGMAGF